MALFTEIRSTVGQEAQIVQAVFPNPSLVMQVFLQRVFAQSVSEHQPHRLSFHSHQIIQIQLQLENLLNRGAALSDLAFLRVLQMVHQQVAQLVEDLKSFELPAVIPRSPMDQNDFNFPTNAAAGTGAGTASTVTIGTMLDMAMEELFVPYIEGQRYLERESKSLSELYASFLTNFTRYHVRPSLVTLRARKAYRSS